MKHLYCDFRVQHLNLDKNWHISFLLVAKSEILYIVFFMNHEAREFLIICILLTKKFRTTLTNCIFVRDTSDRQGYKLF